MTETHEPRQPALIVVTGRPGAGKTTLAHALARAMRCPLVSRDEIKEGLVRTAGDIGPPEAELTSRATDTFFDVLALLLSRGATVVAEAAFQHKVWSPRLEPMRELATIRLVVCELDPELALARRVARSLADPEWPRFHPEPTRSAAGYDPPRLQVPTLRVDTSNGYRPSFETIVEFAHGRSSGTM